MKETLRKTDRQIIIQIDQIARQIFFSGMKEILTDRQTDYMADFLSGVTETPREGKDRYIKHKNDRQAGNIPGTRN